MQNDVAKCTVKPRVWIYKEGPMTMSVCVQGNLTRDEIEAEVNQLSPSGTSAGWVISTDTMFADGIHPMPSPCPDDPARLHYLLNV